MILITVTSFLFVDSSLRSTNNTTNQKLNQIIVLIEHRGQTLKKKISPSLSKHLCDSICSDKGEREPSLSLSLSLIDLSLNTHFASRGSNTTTWFVLLKPGSFTRTGSSLSTYRPEPANSLFYAVFRENRDSGQRKRHRFPMATGNRCSFADTCHAKETTSFRAASERILAFSLFTPVRSFVRSSVHSFVCSFVRSFVRSARVVGKES